ncbi:MAG: CvpA family protein [Epsilonproteobacteria bacterium]|nr:CvpA family protein [Campylobacterota bacterium]
MELNYFDIVVSVIILLLGLKGILNGFFKEVFGLIGIIGGLFVASRVGNEVGQYLSDMFLKLENVSAINFTGFLATLAVFWLFMIFIGVIFKKLSFLSGLGIIDRILGFVFGAGKFFLIAAVIANAAYSIKVAKSAIDESLVKNSVVFPILVQTGAFIMKLDPVEVSQDINETIDKVTDDISDKVVEKTKESAKEVVEETKKELNLVTEEQNKEEEN